MAHIGPFILDILRQHLGTKMSQEKKMFSNYSQQPHSQTSSSVIQVPSQNGEDDDSNDLIIVEPNTEAGDEVSVVVQEASGEVAAMEQEELQQNQTIMRLRQIANLQATQLKRLKSRSREVNVSQLRGRTKQLVQLFDTTIDRVGSNVELLSKTRDLRVELPVLFRVVNHKLKGWKTNQLALKSELAVARKILENVQKTELKTSTVEQCQNQNVNLDIPALPALHFPIGSLSNGNPIMPSASEKSG